MGVRLFLRTFVNVEKRKEKKRKEKNKKERR
jgi:hypothetical protein